MLPPKIYPIISDHAIAAGYGEKVVLEAKRATSAIPSLLLATNSKKGLLILQQHSGKMPFHLGEASPSRPSLGCVTPAHGAITLAMLFSITFQLPALRLKGAAANALTASDFDVSTLGAWDQETPVADVHRALRMLEYPGAVISSALADLKSYDWV